MPELLRLFIICVLIFFCSLSGYASDDAAASSKKPAVIQIIKKPCYIGCGYEFQYCYYYDIANMKDAITVKEWVIEGDYIKGKALADIKAKLLMKACYQLSLTAAYPVVDESINLVAAFDFAIKTNNGKCINEKESNISYSSFELKGDLQKNPISLMQTWLMEDMKGIIKDSVSKAVHDSLSDNNKSEKVYCGDKQYNTVDTDEQCQCGY